VRKQDCQSPVALRATDLTQEKAVGRFSVLGVGVKANPLLRLLSGFPQEHRAYFWPATAGSLRRCEHWFLQATAGWGSNPNQTATERCSERQPGRKPGPYEARNRVVKPLILRKLADPGVEGFLYGGNYLEAHRKWVTSPHQAVSEDGFRLRAVPSGLRCFPSRLCGKKRKVPCCRPSGRGGVTK